MSTGSPNYRTGIWRPNVNDTASQVQSGMKNTFQYPSRDIDGLQHTTQTGDMYMHISEHTSTKKDKK